MPMDNAKPGEMPFKKLPTLIQASHYNNKNAKVIQNRFKEMLIMSPEQAEEYCYIKSPTEAINTRTKKRIILLERIQDSDVFRPEIEKFLIRIAYWSAFIGRISVIQDYIEKLKFSPFIRSYH